MSDKEQRIRTRAYEIWEREGRREGRAEDHWRQAELEIEQALKSPATKATSRINSPWGDPACSKGPIWRVVDGGWHGLAGAGLGRAGGGWRLGVLRGGRGGGGC